MERASTLFLRLAVTIIGLGVAALCILLLPLIWQAAYIEYPRDGYAVRTVVAAMYVAAIPFYLGIYKGWLILNAVDKGKAFSMQSVKELKVIALCAGIISFIYVVCLPFFYIWAQSDDAPGLVLVGLFFVGMPLIVSVAMSLLQRLLAQAVFIKSENDLTV